MNEDIKVEDVHTELKSAGDEPKVMNKLHKLTDKLLLKVNGRINAERDIVRKKLTSASETLQSSIAKFVSDTNTDLKKFKDRYEAMYTDLVRRILFNMEGRVFAAEIFEQASLDLLVKKIYRLENNLKPEDEVDHIGYQAYVEDCSAEHEKLMQKHANEFANKQKEAESVESAKEEKEGSNEDSDGTKDECCDQANTEISGTEDKPDGGQAE